MMPIEMPDDLGRVVTAGVGLLLPCEANDTSGVKLLRLGQSVLHVEQCGDFNPRPLDPGVDSGGKFDDLGDVRSAYAGGGLEEVEAAVGLRLDELGVSDPGDEAERFDDVGVHSDEAKGFARFPVETVGTEDAALMHGLHGRLAVFVGRAEERSCRSR